MTIARRTSGDRRAGARRHRADDPPGRGAQGDHVQVHLQRRRLPDPRDRCAQLPRARRRRADVADDLRRCVPVGRVDSRRAGRGAHAAVERRRRLRRAEARAHADAEGARRHPDLGDRRQPARLARSGAAEGRAEERLEAGRAGSRAQLPAEFTLAADKMEDTQEFTLPAGTTEAKWVRAVDLLPGTPSIVRSATIVVKDAAAGVAVRPGAGTRARALAAGTGSEPIDSGVGFKLPAGAQLGVRIHYKKTWQFEGKALTDRSTVGLYLRRRRQHAGTAGACRSSRPRRRRSGPDGEVQPHARRGRAGAGAQPRQGPRQHLAAGRSGEAGRIARRR